MEDVAIELFEDASVQIFDNTNVVVYHQSLEKGRRVINMGNHPVKAGIYNVMVQSNSGVHYSKLIFF
jgi:hypothetical protein